MSVQTTNLGNQAQTGVLIANTQVRSPSFTQPQQVVGSAATPSATATQAYVAGITKYVFFFPLTTATAITQTFTLTSFPDGFFATNSAFTSATCVPSASFGTIPILSAPHQIADQTANTFQVNPLSSTSPVFASGTAYMKVVISFTQD
jgi:hypothetical protein